MIVRGLVKNFAGKVAVDGLDLDIYEGQIFGLLGHNGAGKTTTISMLTGLIPPTKGDMTIQGHILSQDLSKIRENLGVCPQHNILFPELTPLEHMAMFCMFKGISDSERIKQLSVQKLSELELTHKQDTEARFLSGGQKRKLQLALALIGDSQIVLLDEPTSGMDLTARRHMWDMLKNNKSGRIIILTTHYMEEADVLADRIAIMSHGKLRCCGSSLFLKSRYGVGYYLVMVRNQEAVTNTKVIEKFVKDHVDGAKLLTDFHGEITFQLPSSSTAQFQDFFQQLDSKFESFGLLSYSMSATTLEEVFLRVARGDDELKNQLSLNRESENSPLIENNFALINDRQGGSLFFKHFQALLKKRALSTLRDKKSLLFEICIPILLIIVGLSLMMIPSLFKNYSAYELRVSRYQDTQKVFYDGDKDGFDYVKNIPDVNSVKAGVSTLEDFSDFLFDEGDLRSKRVFSYYFNDASEDLIDVAIFTDQKAFQSYPTAYSAISNQILKNKLGSDFNIKYFNHPLPITDSMYEMSGSGDGYVGSLIFSLGFSFIPTGIVLFIAKEREISIKHQHMISGVSLSAYWLSNFLWDTVKHMVTAVISSLIILAFNIDIYTDDNNDYGAMWVLIILAGISQATFAYALSFLFKNHSTAQVFTLIFSIVCGSLFPSAVFVMFAFDNSRDAGKVLAWILKVFPNFCFGWGVINVGSKETFKVLLELDEAYDSFDINSAGGCMLLMGIMTLVYLGLVVVFELFETNPNCSRIIHTKKKIEHEEFEHDDDVDRETEVANNTDPSTVQVNVKKVFKSFKVQKRVLTAVNEVSFNVNPEECFALLGVNGAGKTTTFKILTGEVFSDSGSAYIGGFNVSKQLSKARNLIGYCPQFDAISELLTGKEHLELYAHIKGIPKDKVQEQVEYMLQNMDLSQYRDVLAGTYSGGNKRKLSVAMALIGNPSVVFLDEPSAGMDPEARKKMWKILGRIKKQKSAVILTTHSMEEAEALCDRMTIMVRGRLKCIGTSTWIKNKFGDGYEIEVKVEPPEKDFLDGFTRPLSVLPNSHMGISFQTLPEALRIMNLSYLEALIKPIGPGAGIYNTLSTETYITLYSLAAWCLVENLGKHIETWIISEFTAVEVIEHYHLMFKFKIKKEHVKSIGYLFSMIESKKHELRISDYSICMTSLEQIFNRFAKKAEMEEVQRLNQNS
jgi:ATP-binding cassette subfamily A (ABC1) protein 3